jgi:acetyl-CoA C-acetyltransferase
MSDGAFIYEAVRTPRGRGKQNGSLHTIKAVDLLATSLSALATRSGLTDGGRSAAIEDVSIGCVTQTGEQGSCIARSGVLLAGLDESVPAATTNRFCGSGLEAVNEIAAKVAAGFIDLGVGGGVESMSRVPMGSDGGALWDPMMEHRYGMVPQGISADLLATLNGITRADADAFALRSQRLAAEAWARGEFDRAVVPVLDPLNPTAPPVLARDEYFRPDTTLEGLAKLRPAFDAMGEQFGFDDLARKRYPHVEVVNHIHTPGNSSGIVDGSAAVLIGSRAAGEALGRAPRARIRAAVSVGGEPVLMLAEPVAATRKALKKAGMSIADIDLFEVNEAFAAVPLFFAQQLEVPLEKINVNGGAIALGHPLGATGAVLLDTVLCALERRGLGVGLVTLCIGGGMGIATIIERV